MIFFFTYVYLNRVSSVKQLTQKTQTNTNQKQQHQYRHQLSIQHTITKKRLVCIKCVRFVWIGGFWKRIHNRSISWRNRAADCTRLEPRSSIFEWTATTPNLEIYIQYNTYLVEIQNECNRVAKYLHTDWFGEISILFGRRFATLSVLLSDDYARQAIQQQQTCK